MATRSHAKRSAPLMLAVALCAMLLAPAAAVMMLDPYIISPTAFPVLRTSYASTLHQIQLPAPAAAGTPGQAYTTAPMIVDLHGTRQQIGYDYAALLHSETADTLTSFLSSVYPDPKDQEMIIKFADWLWDSFLSKYTPPQFLAELDGMKAFYAANPGVAAADGNVTADMVSQRFYTLANMPADPVNIISMLEQELEQGLPVWLRTIINDIIRILEHLGHSCDAYGVWGSRTVDELLYSSRNLDYASDTGINKHKLVIFYHIDDPKFGGKPPGGVYASVGFAFGPGALAGMSQAGLTTSEMNLDNSVVTFSGVPFPLRLRMVLEGGTDLASAMQVWHDTNNTNSFNFLIGSAPDALALKSQAAGARNGSAAYALETIMGYTAQFGANSSVEADATFMCTGTKCRGWTSETGEVRIGKPLPEAVWRTNHGFAPRVMATQEPLFNNTVFRYDLMHTMFEELQAAGQAIDDTTAVAIVATVGTKGVNYYTCDQELNGDNVMSIAYAPGPRGASASGVGRLYMAWESGSSSTWRPAACSPYITLDFDAWM